jgi:hypothetical protein
MSLTRFIELVNPNGSLSLVPAIGALQFVGGEYPPLLTMTQLGLPAGGSLAAAVSAYTALQGLGLTTGQQVDVYA